MANGDRTLRCDRQNEVLAHYLEEAEPNPAGDSTEPKTARSRTTAGPVEVDRIDKDLIAAARVKDIARAMDPPGDPAGAWVRSNLDTLRGRKPWPLREERKPTVPVYTSAQALEPSVWAQIQDLLRPLPRRQRRSKAGLFLVDKKGQVKRVIVDARPANATLEPLPGLRLFGLDQLLRSSCRAAERQDLGVFTADFRHFFYQLPVPEPLAQYFGIEGPAGLMVPKALPMGLHGAPVLAQTVSLSAVLLALIRMGGIFEAAAQRIRRQGEMPEEIRAGSLSCMVLLDGLQLLGGAAEVASFAEAFASVCEDFRLRPKEWSLQVIAYPKPASPVLKSPACSSWPPMAIKSFARGRACLEWDFAGVVFRVRRGRSRQDFAWRPRTEKLVPELGSVATPRRISAVIGALLWRARVLQEDLLRDHEPLMDAASWVGQEAQQTQWDARISVPAQLQKALNERSARANAAEGQWAQTLRPTLWEKPGIEGPVVAAAADADPTHCGGVIWLAKETRVWGFKSDQDGQQRAEAFASLGVATECSVLRPGARMLLAVDNEGVRESLRRGYAAAPHLRQLIKALWALPVAVAPVRVPGIENVADDPSRGCNNLDPAREEKTRAYLEEERIRLGWPEWEA